MKTNTLLCLHLAGVLGICVLGTLAGWLRLRALARWCQAQLTDTDGQAEI